MFIDEGQATAINYLCKKFSISRDVNIITFERGWNISLQAALVNKELMV